MNNLNKKNGFTLLETLIGIAILATAITATFSAVQSGLSNSIEARDQVTAFFLGQEAIEYVRNIRDANALLGVNWLRSLAELPSDACYFGKVCIIDSAKSQSFPPQSCSGAGNCPSLRQDRTTGSATYAMFGNDPSWTQSIYNREISFQQVSTNEVLMTVTMRWSKGNSSKSLTIRESVFNWQ